MLTKNKAKLIKSLDEKKHRNETRLFLVEGKKSVEEVLESDFEIDSLVTTETFARENHEIISRKNIPCELATQEELEKIGTLQSNDSAIAIVRQKENTQLTIDKGEIVLALDDVRDPGNLGTIIRIADWYGVKKIIASQTTTDHYNPKTISATKGSFTRVSVYYTDLAKFLTQSTLPVFGAFLNGEDVHTAEFPTSGILVMGNESNGIGEEVEKIIKNKITIPSYGKAESLNVGIATAVILDNWKRITR